MWMNEYPAEPDHRHASLAWDRHIEERHGFPGALRTLGGGGGPCRGPPRNRRLAYSQTAGSSASLTPKRSATDA